ncbi:MAG: sulfopyruvate decarboxylase subunit beta [Candidatus Omnitrophica bacterium]|nr:sulfopyruvate decarboxylase subunit beta [Candidatus Omnitrophota bacterium]
MTAREAVAVVASRLSDELVVCTTGYTCRDLQVVRDRPGNFYMIGSMGLAASLGLGLAIHRPQRRVVVLDGDGSVLMGLGNLPMAGAWGPENFLHVVLDNGVYASTGGQPTPGGQVSLEQAARVFGYAAAVKAATREELLARWDELEKKKGPRFLLVKCSPTPGAPSPRVRLSPDKITKRFRQAVKK